MMELIRGAPVVTHYFIMLYFVSIPRYKSGNLVGDWNLEWRDGQSHHQVSNYILVTLWMEEIRLTSWYGKYPIMCRVSYMSGVVWDFFMSSMAFMMFLISLMSLHFLPELVMNWHTLYYRCCRRFGGLCFFSDVCDDVRCFCILL